MLTFSPIALSDKTWIDPIVFAEGSLSADFNFGNLYLWDETYCQLAARLNDRMIAKPKYFSRPFFACPIGTGDLAAAVDEMREYAAGRGFPFVIRGVTAEYKAALDALYPGRWRFEANRKHFDYIYSAERLATLAGKKLHSKRNHINRFLAENDWRFEALTPAHFPACRILLESWTAGAALDPGVASERKALERAFTHFEALGLLGGALFSGGRLIAFTMGERIAKNAFDVHFEKADAAVNGAYAMINREFVRLILERYPAVEWINREDDMGLEGLRKAKESYYPDLLVEKFTARWA